MRILLFILLTAISLSSCKKDDISIKDYSKEIVGIWMEIDHPYHEEFYLEFTYDKEIYSYINTNFNKKGDPWVYSIKGNELTRRTHPSFDDYIDPLTEIFKIDFKNKDELILNFNTAYTDGNWDIERRDIYLKRIK